MSELLLVKHFEFLNGAQSSRAKNTNDTLMLKETHSKVCYSKFVIFLHAIALLSRLILVEILGKNYEKSGLLNRKKMNQPA